MNVTPSGPFFRGLFQVDLLAAAEALCSAYAQDADGVATALDYVAPFEEKSVIPGNQVLPPGFVVVLDGYVFVLLTGTQNNTQQILNIVGSTQTEFPGIPGGVGAYWGDAALTMWPQILSLLPPTTPLKKVVFLGHSLGGAICEIMLPLFQAQFPETPVVCFVYGCPRPGNAAFAAAVGSLVNRVEDVGDPVVALPPPVWAGPGSTWPVSGPPPYDLWVHPGSAVTVDQAGTITAGSDPMGTLQAALVLATDQVLPHYMTEYARRLNALLPPGDLTHDVSLMDDPFSLVPNLYYLLGGSNVASPGQAPAAGSPVYKVYLTYNYGAAGIGEEWYSTLSPDVLRSTTIPNYLAARMAMAVSQFEFVYARISNPAQPRWVDFLTQNDPGVTRFGLLGPNIKDVPATGSEDDGALLSRMKLVGGPSARQFLHAFDQTQTNEGQFTPNATFKKAYANYTKFLKDAGNGVQFQYGGVAPARLDITTIAAKPTRGFTVTPAAAATVAVGDRVYIGNLGRSIVGANGVKIVTKAPAGGATFDVGGASPVGTYNGVGGYYYKVVPNLAVVSYMQVERLTAHKVGRPFAEPRGRKSARLSLRL